MTSESSDYSCHICMAEFCTVPSKLECCNKLCCLTCIRNMFNLNDNSKITRACSFCNFSVLTEDTTGFIYYNRMSHLYEVIDAMHGIFTCPRGCNFNGNTSEILTHLRSTCEYSTMRCSYCEKTIVRSLFDSHEDSCIVKCRKCRKDILRTEFEMHKNECVIKRSCFCGKQMTCDILTFKAHVERHRQNSEFRSLLNIYDGAIQMAKTAKTLHSTIATASAADSIENDDSESNEIDSEYHVPDHFRRMTPCDALRLAFDIAESKSEHPMILAAAEKVTSLISEFITVASDRIPSLQQEVIKLVSDTMIVKFVCGAKTEEPVYDSKRKKIYHVIGLGCNCMKKFDINELLVHINSM